MRKAVYNFNYYYLSLFGEKNMVEAGKLPAQPDNYQTQSINQSICTVIKKKIINTVKPKKILADGIICY